MTLCIRPTAYSVLLYTHQSLAQTLDSVVSRRNQHWVTTLCLWVLPGMETLSSSTVLAASSWWETAHFSVLVALLMPWTGVGHIHCAQVRGHLENHLPRKVRTQYMYTRPPNIHINFIHEEALLYVFHNNDSKSNEVLHNTLLPPEEKIDILNLEQSHFLHFYNVH